MVERLEQIAGGVRRRTGAVEFVIRQSFGDAVYRGLNFRAIRFEAPCEQRIDQVVAAEVLETPDQ
jgi:hypothetical protein